MADLFSRTLASVDDALSGAIVGASSYMTTEMRPFFVSMVSASVILFGYKIWMAMDRNTFREMAERSIALLVVLIFMFTPGLIMSVFYVHIPGVGIYIGDQLTTAFGLRPIGGGLGVGAVIDDTLGFALHTGRNLFEAGGWTEPAPIFLGLFIWLFSLAVVGYAAYIIVFSKVVLALMAILGPLFFALYLFEKTQPMFWRWVGVILQFTFVPILTFTILGLLAPIMHTTAQNAQETTADLLGADWILAYLMMSFVILGVLMQVLGIAATLTSGIMMGTGGAVGMGVAAAAGIAYGTSKGYQGAKNMAGKVMSRMRGSSQGDGGRKSGVTGAADAVRTAVDRVRSSDG